MAALEVFRKTLGNLATNCYLLVNHDTNECVIFDPAAEAEVLKEIIEEKNLTVKAIFLTHGHYDHMGAAKQLKEWYSVPIYCSKEENEQILNNVQANLSSWLGFPATLQADVLLRDGEKVDIIGTTLECLLTPGHTAGGMCYYIEQMQLVFVGDTLFAGSVGRTDFPTGSESKLIRSIQEKLFILPDETKVLPGHMDTTTIVWEKETNMSCGIKG